MHDSLEPWSGLVPDVLFVPIPEGGTGSMDVRSISCSREDLGVDSFNETWSVREAEISNSVDMAQVRIQTRSTYFSRFNRGELGCNLHGLATLRESKQPVERTTRSGLS